MAGGSIKVRLRAKKPYKDTTGIESTVMNSGYGKKGKDTNKRSKKPKGALAQTF